MYYGRGEVSKGLGLAETVVLRLMDHYLDVGATLFTDNFYTSISANEGSKVAASKSKKVSTFCESCEWVSFLCLSWFRVKVLRLSFNFSYF